MGKRTLTSTLTAVSKKIRKPMAKRDSNVFLTSEYAKHSGVAVCTARKALRKLQESGNVERCMVEVEDVPGRINRHPGWRYVEERTR
jgi:ribosomal protein S25